MMRGWATGHIAVVAVEAVQVEEAGEVVEIRAIEVGDLDLEVEEEVVVVGVGPVRYRRSASSPPVPSEYYPHLY